MDKSSSYEMTGYQHIKSVLTDEQVVYFRKKIAELAEQGTAFPVSPKYCLKDEFILETAFSSILHSQLKEKFHAEYIMFPDIEIQYNSIGGAYNSSVFSGWHVDSNSEGIKEYLTNKDYGFAKVGIYFQENCEEYGGGVDLISRSHKFPFLGSYKTKFLIKKIINKLSVLGYSEVIETHPGDALFFDSRLMHRSTKPSEKYTKKQTKNFLDEQFVKLPISREKIVLYFDVAYPNSCLEFWENATKRALDLSDPSHEHFRSYTDLENDFSLFCDFASRNGVTTIFDKL